MGMIIHADSASARNPLLGLSRHDRRSRASTWGGGCGSVWCAQRPWLEAPLEFSFVNRDPRKPSLGVPKSATHADAKSTHISRSRVDFNIETCKAS